MASVTECTDFLAQIAAADARHLWLACSGRGRDGHGTAASSPAPTTAATAGASCSTRIVSGHLAQMWAISPSKAYIGQCRGPVIVTTDGGATWVAAGDFQIDGDRCVTPVVFTDEQHGYAGDTDTTRTGATRIWRTADAGRTWQPVDVN